MSTTKTKHRIGTSEEWLAARETLLAREKEHTRLGDEIAQLRRELPWVRVEKEYCFDTGDGARTLAELFDGRGQLAKTRKASARRAPPTKALLPLSSRPSSVSRAVVA